MKDGEVANIHVPKLGSTVEIEQLTKNKTPFSGYFDQLVKMLLKIGYTRNVNLIGAPYDFRKFPCNLLLFLRFF